MSEPKLEFILDTVAYQNYINSLIEKDKAKAPEITHGVVFCPNCKKAFDDVPSPYGRGPIQSNYCPNCGQRLDWEFRWNESVDVEKIVEEMSRIRAIDFDVFNQSNDHGEGTGGKK